MGIGPEYGVLLVCQQPKDATLVGILKAEVD